MYSFYVFCVSSTNHFHSFNLSFKLAVTETSSSTMNILAMVDPSMFIKCKMYVFVQKVNNSFISCLGISVIISLSTYILWKIISIVSSNATFINYDAAYYSSGMFCFWINFKKCLMLLFLMLCLIDSNLFNGANI